MNMELNKVFAAILTAGITGYMCWFIASHILYPVEEHRIEKNAFPVEVAGGAGEAQPAAAAGPEPLDMSKADAAAGAKISSVCSACHTFGRGEPAKVGPNLAGVVGAAHGRMEGFAYSAAMKQHAGEKWDYEALNKFLWNPQKAVPGTKMTFAGLKKAEDRANVIKWLETQK